MNELRVRTSLGRDMDCRVVWRDPKAKHFPHIVVEDEHGRRFLARHVLGAWSEVSLETAAAKLNATLNASLTILAQPRDQQ